MKNTQIYPIVTIEPPNTPTSWGNHYPDVIHLSTNNVTLDHVHATQTSEIDLISNVYFKPILLNIPSIKQSIDIESRKFKISNVSLNISNYEYQGERFSDILSEKSLINWKVSIQFVSPSAKKFTTIFNVSNYDDDISFYERYSNDDNFKNEIAQMVYQGVIRRISHDDEKVKIELEDLTEQKAHKDLPLSLYPDGTQGYLGSDANIPDKYKNKPIPMVYGKVQRSPLVVTSNFRSLTIDSKEIDGTNNVSSGFEDTTGNSIKYGALYINDDNQYINVIEDGQYTSDGSIIEFDLTNEILFPDISSAEEEKFFNCLDGNSSFNFTVKNSIYNNELQGEDYFSGGSLDKITDGENQPNICTINTDPINDDLEETRTYGFNDIEKLFIDFSINYAPNYDFKESSISGFRINGINLPKVIATLHGDNANAYAVLAKSPKPNGTLGDSISGTSEDYFTGFSHMGEELVHDELRNLFGFFVGGVNVNSNAAIQLNYTNSTIGATHATENGVIVFYTVPNNYSFNIQFRGVYDVTHSGTAGEDELTFAPEFEMVGDIKEISLLRSNKVLKPFSYDFYADVNGRVNTFDDHPFIITLTNESVLALYDEYGSEVTWWGDIVFYNLYYGALQSGSSPYSLNTMYNFIVNKTSFDGFDNVVSYLKNPIDIIYDILRSELGLNAQQIDEDDYYEAREEHKDWKFAFTINKKINSKKLIEGIAKSTKCFPHFRNDGKFAFNTIKDSYLIEDDYNPATEIYEQDVINYSFKKTKPEDIVSEVGVRYKKDYAQDSYSRDIFSYYEEQGWYTKYGTFNDYPHNWEYYGIYDPEDNYLEVESDYIRIDDTAHKLREFLFQHYKNAHLIFNLKLPLSYSQLDIGDLVKFRSLLNGVKPYGIDYRAVDIVNGQYYYPLFMVTSIKKNLDSIEIECMQLHNLTTGVEGSISQNTGYFNDNNEGDLFYFPDHTPATATPQDAQIVEEEIIEEEVVYEPEGTLIDSIEIPQNQTVVFKLQEGEFIGTASAQPENKLWRVMHLSKFSPNITESFIIDDFGDGIINTYQGVHEITNAPTEIAIVEDWYSVPTSPYVSMKMEFSQSLQGENTYKFILGDRNASDIEHSMNMWFMGGTTAANITTPISPYEVDIEYSEAKYVKLTNYGTDTIIFTPSMQLDYIGVVPATDIFDNAPPFEGMLGDNNQDGSINILDVVLTVNMVVGNLPEVPEADWNQDGLINVLDIVSIVNHVLES